MTTSKSTREEMIAWLCALGKLIDVKRPILCSLIRSKGGDDGKTTSMRMRWRYATLHDGCPASDY